MRGRYRRRSLVAESRASVVIKARWYTPSRRRQHGMPEFSTGSLIRREFRKRSFVLVFNPEHGTHLSVLKRETRPRRFASFVALAALTVTAKLSAFLLAWV